MHAREGEIGIVLGAVSLVSYLKPSGAARDSRLWWIPTTPAATLSALPQRGRAGAPASGGSARSPLQRKPWGRPVESRSRVDPPASAVPWTCWSRSRCQCQTVHSEPQDAAPINCGEPAMTLPRWPQASTPSCGKHRSDHGFSSQLRGAQRNGPLHELPRFWVVAAGLEVALALAAVRLLTLTGLSVLRLGSI